MYRIPNFIACEETGKYLARKMLTENQIINAAKKILGERVKKEWQLKSTSIVKDYLIAHYSPAKNEKFICLFLDSQFQLMSIEELFQGTIDKSIIYPREVARRAIELNAAAIIFAHNHPSGNCKPSEQDEIITHELKQALSMFEIKTLDHIIVAGNKAYSFAEKGLL